MITSAYLLIALIVLYAYLVLLSNWRYNRQVNRLFALMDKSAPRIFSFSQLSGLPSPVEKYFRLVLKEGSIYPRTIRLKHGGQFKTALDKPCSGTSSFRGKVHHFWFIAGLFHFCHSDTYCTTIYNHITQLNTVQHVNYIGLVSIKLSPVDLANKLLSMIKI